MTQRSLTGFVASLNTWHFFRFDGCIKIETIICTFSLYTYTQDSYSILLLYNVLGYKLTEMVKGRFKNDLFGESFTVRISLRYYL